MKVSRLFKPTYGNIKGKCVVCGEYTDNGHKVKFSGNFTSWNMLYYGDCICEYCYTLCKNQDYRRKSWIASKKGIVFLKRGEVLEVLLNPPEPPFSVYITKTGKKQGFFKLIDKPALSRDKFFVVFDDVIIYIDREKLEKMVKIAKKARSLGFTKTDLFSPSINCWKKNIELCIKIENELKGDPLWELVIYLI